MRDDPGQTNSDDLILGLDVYDIFTYVTIAAGLYIGFSIAIMAFTHQLH